MKPEDFDLFATIVKQRAGLVLTREKAYLLESRLLPIARKHNLKSLEDMAQSIRTQRDEAMQQAIAEAMTINQSAFFRDQKPFTRFRDTLLPQLLRRNAARRHIRIWSAASSSGQEAYSLAMVCAEEAAALQGWRVDIIGSDLSHAMIERAESGAYTHFEVQRGLPIRMLLKYFRQIEPDKWQINDSIREMVQFREVNLLHDFGPVGIFDVVFCRNVLPTFDSTTRVRVLNVLASIMAPEGALFLSNGETIHGVGDKFRSANDTNDYYIASGLPGAGIARQAVY